MMNQLEILEKKLILAEKRVKKAERNLENVLNEIKKALPEKVMEKNDVAIEVFANGDWKSVGESNNKLSLSASVVFFSNIAEAKNSEIYKILTTKFGFSEEKKTLRFVTDEKNLGL